HILSPPADNSHREETAPRMQQVDGLDIADLLNNDDKLTSPLGSPYTMGSSRAELDGADPAPQNRDPLHLLSAPPPLLSPTATLCGPKDWPLRTARHAKRARVENIIRDMAGSSFSPFLEPDTDGAPEDGQGDKGPREWPPDGVQAQRAGRSSVVGCWSSEDPAIKNQLQNMKCQPLLKFRRSGGKDPYDIFTDPHSCGRKKVRVQTASSSPGTRPRQGTPPGTSLYGETVCGSTLPEVQTEALSLVVQRAPRLRPYAICRPPHQHHGEQEFPSSHRSEPQGSEGNKGGAADPVLATGGAPGSKVRCKVNSRSVRGARHFALDPGFLGDLCVPMDVQTRADGPQSMLMSTLHLKKAKLMFFYTRYPNSLVLKTFFHDVQFTRCITSQLIKWFSNFREFYYIQMEKQARQAVAEGVAHTGALTVGRESELFRTLNMHYNKASDFQVPERFLEVAEMTLREFYVAVSLGKDCDPSWKKPIYKVICKLDSNVPEEFKAHYPD
uniref:Prospero domain-containing protein n=1 Tax=Gadus morhua TaxID=8049 RepID=A0A8C4ZCE9_GADMO